MKAVIFVVDADDFSWNTFLDIAFDWAPILKQVYDSEDSKLDDV